MSTLLLDSIYAIVAKDSIGTTFVKTKELCQFVNEAGTNCQDVMIVLIICAAIILMATIVAITMSIWHTKEMQVRSEMEKEKYNREKEQREKSVELEERREKLKKDSYESRRIFDAIMEQKINKTTFSDYKTIIKDIHELTSDEK